MKLTEYEYNQLIENLALEAAKSRVKNNKATGVKSVSVPVDRFNPERKDPVDAYFEDYSRRIKKAYPYESMDENRLADLQAFSGDKAMEWMDFGGMGPSEFAKAVEAAKFLPLLQGRTDDPDEKNWQNMGQEQLRREALNLGWDPRTNEGFAEFLNKVGEYQQTFDRAKLSKELREMPEYKVSSLFFPTTVKGIDNAVATGEGGEKSDIAKLAALDAIANSAIFMAPSASVLKANPVLNGAIDAGLQGAAELARQYGASAIDESIEPDPDAAIFATTAGATRPAVVGTAQMYATKVPGRAMRDVSRGIGKATRAGNPAMQERDRLIGEITDYNKAVKKGDFAPREVVMDLADENRYKALFNTRNTMNELGVKKNADGTFDVADFLKKYDRKPVKANRITSEGLVENVNPNAKVKPSQVLLTEENTPAYNRYFGAKLADEASNNQAAKVGLNIGRFLGDLGGRVEPMLKGNPFSFGPQTFKPYTMSDWYKKIKEDQKKVEASKIIDAIMKGSE